MAIYSRYRCLFVARPFDKACAQGIIDSICGKNGNFQKLELWLAKECAEGKSGLFFVGDTATAPDFHIYEMLHQHKFMCEFFGVEGSVWSAFPKLNAFYDTFKSHPNNAKYFASSLSKLPFNNKIAGFGPTLGGEPWTDDTTYDWGNVSGEY